MKRTIHMTINRSGAFDVKVLHNGKPVQGKVFGIDASMSRIANYIAWKGGNI